MKAAIGKFRRVGIDRTMNKLRRIGGLTFVILLVLSALVFAGGGPNVSGAKLYIQQNQLDNALGVLNKEINEVDANNEDAWYLLGYVYARQRQYEKMKEAFDKAVALKPEFKDKGIKISKDSGTVFHSQFGAEMIFKIIWGDAFNKGVKYFNDAINSPDEAIDLSQIQEGMSADQVKNIVGEPLEVNVTQVAGKKDEQWVYGGSSYVYVKDGIVHGIQYKKEDRTAISRKVQLYELAINNFKMSATIMPDSVMAYRNMAAALMNMGRFEDSVEPLTQAIQRDPKDFESQSLLAQVYLTAGKDSLATPILAKLWKDNYRTDEVADSYARTLIRAGKIDDAKTIYKEALETSPNNFQFRYNYGTILLEANDYDAAIEQLQMAYSVDSTSADINYNLGAAYLNRGVAYREKLPTDSPDTGYMKDFEKAFPYLERSVKLNPEEQQIWFALGRIAGQLNKIALAGYAFSKGDNVRSALDQKVFVGMPSDALLTLFGEPDSKKVVESREFTGIEEWVYKRRAKGARKVAIADPLKVYVMEGRVDALIVEK